mmetsp:Transcript_114213/g.363023  ORF Transcript_114213/g.363023 Transcript_114213/m.363023 type:complete len:221 (-) Transcript_114213:226-888(-)
MEESSVPTETNANQVAKTCAVCFAEDEPPVSMPCCTREDSTVGFCRRCIEIICEQGVGLCPNCRQYISIDYQGRVSIIEKQDKCRICCQTRVIVGRGMCDACLLGSRFSFQYECNRCHRFQRIPHPMWRYQPSPNDFGTASWACQAGCGDYTMWRISATDAPNVPDSDCPEGWGRKDQWLAAVREQRLQERSLGNLPSSSSASGNLPSSSSDSRPSCTVS